MLFGQPRLLDDRQRPIAVPAKTFALLAYLVLTERAGPARRGTLRQLLWENSESKAAAANLRKFLSRVTTRQEEDGFELIRNGRNHVELVSASAFIDLIAFQKVVTDRDSADLETLCDLYCGDLLEGIDWEGSDFQSWLQQQRTILRDAFVATVANRLEPLDSKADRVKIKVAARRLREVDPYNEIAHRTLMRLHAEDGEPARVRDVYEHLKASLGDELNVQPDEATRGLYQTLLPKAAPKAVAAPAYAGLDEGEQDPTAPEPDDSLLPLLDRAQTPRVSVLPPPPLGGQDFAHQLADALIEDVTIGLCRSKALSVVAPYTAARLSRSGKHALLGKFRISYAVETRLKIRGSNPTLRVSLLDAATREILWVDNYLLDQDTIAHQYNELSVRIIVTLIERIERAELARYETLPDPTAYHLYLAGQKHLRALDLPSVRRARRHFKAAVGACSSFVPALSALARTYLLEWLLMARGDSELLGEAERLALLSQEIDPDDARGYRELGVCRLYAGRFDESVAALGHAEDRSPQFADLLHDLADAFSHTCDFQAALQKITKAIELNPLCPDQYWWAAAGTNYHLQRYSDAIECMGHMRDQSAAYRLMAASHAMLGDAQTARFYVEKTKDIHPGFSISNWLSIVPIQDPHYAKHYEQGLREAGFE